jgi:hypothetical protein
MIDDGVHDGKGHLLGRVRTQLCQEIVFFDTDHHPAIPQGYLLARIVTSALHADISLT